MISLKITRLLLITVLFTILILTLLRINSNLTSTAPVIHNLVPKSGKASNVPGGYVKEEKFVPSNESYCEFQYGFPKELLYASSDVDTGPELGKSGNYRILYNMIGARVDGNVPGVTYATHVTADFAHYIPELLRYWQGYISIAAFVPDTDVALFLEQINQYCYCLPGMSRVSVHLVFHKKVSPSRKDVFFMPPATCQVEDSSKIETYRSLDETTMYPINVCRNAARTAALTEYVLVSDIQLMPSGGLAEKFMTMVDNYKILGTCDRQVFVLPIFEVEPTEQIPLEKKQLIELIHQQKAVYFHKNICRHCQKFPGIEAWMISTPGDEIKPLLTTKREVPYHRWEPIYIGTKNEPYYNEALSWEGLQDKMLQTLEMCLIGYKFVILDGAYLIHWPGMKKTKTSQGEKWRESFIKDNTREYQNILKKLVPKYPTKPQCKPK